MKPIPAQPDGPRGAERHPVDLPGTLRDDEHRPHDIVVEDLSLSGFRVPSWASLAVGTEIGLGLAGIGARSARVVRVDGTGGYGCRFDMALTSHELARAMSTAAIEQIVVFQPAARPVPAATAILPGVALPEPSGAPGLWRIALMLGVSAALWAAISGISHLLR